MSVEDKVDSNSEVVFKELLEEASGVESNDTEGANETQSDAKNQEETSDTNPVDQPNDVDTPVQESTSTDPDTGNQTKAKKGGKGFHFDPKKYDGMNEDQLKAELKFQEERVHEEYVRYGKQSNKVGDLNASNKKLEADLSRLVAEQEARDKADPITKDQINELMEEDADAGLDLKAESAAQKNQAIDNKRQQDFVKTQIKCNELAPDYLDFRNEIADQFLADNPNADPRFLDQIRVNPSTSGLDAIDVMHLTSRAKQKKELAELKKQLAEKVRQQKKEDTYDHANAINDSAVSMGASFGSAGTAPGAYGSVKLAFPELSG
jgi:hypothetical protein